MKEKIMKWLPGLLCAALVAGNLTYVSAGMPDVDTSGRGAGSVSGSDRLQADGAGSDRYMSGSGVSWVVGDASISGNDLATLGSGDSAAESGGISADQTAAAGNDVEDVPMPLDNDVSWSPDSTGIAFSRQYQALMDNSYGQHYCVDFDECPEAECDILFGSKYVKASEMDFYVYSDYHNSWVDCSFNGWELVRGMTFTIQETSYPEENRAIKLYDPRTYEYEGRTYRLADADLVISGGISKDPAVWGDEEYHGVGGGYYWFADEGLLIVSGELLSTPDTPIVSPAYKADRILYTNYYIKKAGIRDKIKTVCLDANITEIGEWAFRNCKGLEKVVFDGAVTVIGDHAFSGTAVTDIRIPDGVDTIGAYAFSWCEELKTLDLNQAAVVKNNAFSNCPQLTLTEFPDSVVAVGDEAFYQCPHVVIEELPEGLSDENIGENAFLIPYTITQYLIDFDYGNADGYRPLNPEKILGTAAYQEYYNPERTVADALMAQPLQKKYGYVADGRVRYPYSLSYPECDALSEEEIYERFLESYGDGISDPSPDDFVCLGYAPCVAYDADGEYREYTFMGTVNRSQEAYSSSLTDKVEPSRNIYLYYRDAASVTELSGITAEYTGGAVAEGSRINREDIAVKADYTTIYESGTKRASQRNVVDGFTIDPGTAALGENQVTVSLSERPDVSFPFPDFIYNCYDVGSVPDYLWAWVRSYDTDSGRNYLDDGQHGEEMEESLKGITKTADILVIGRDRTESRRYQTGIEASYPRLSQMEGSAVVREDITVYPLFTVEFDNGTEEENVRGDTPLLPEEYETDRQTLEKGGNTVTVASGGFEDTFEVFGNYKDGIIAEYPKSEEAEGTILGKGDFTVFYTYTRMDPDSGEMSCRVPDRDSTVGSFELDEDTIRLGGNTITVTETDDDAAWTDRVDITGTTLQVDPDPTPEPDPTPTPEPNPTPTPEPNPIPEPDPEFTPTPEPDPTPTLESDPTPDSNPTPTQKPDPASDPESTATPESDPAPMPEPALDFAPMSEPTPTPDPDSTRPSATEPAPNPLPVSMPVPLPESTPEPGAPTTSDPAQTSEQESAADPDPTSVSDLGSGTTQVSLRTGYCPKLEIALTAGILGAALTALGGFLLFLLLSRRRKRFSGILTDEPVGGIKLKPYRRPYVLMQDVIDGSASLGECMEKLQESGDFTYLPKDTAMSVLYTNRDGIPARTDREADERAMYRILEEMEGCGRVEVALYDDETFEIVLVFHL